jgi:cell division topological specificity factor
MSMKSWWSSLSSLLLGQRRASAQQAKMRLQTVLAHERSARGLPEYLPMLQRELQLVVAKYVDVAPRDVSVRIGHPRHAPSGHLEVRIELPQVVHA